MRTHFFLTLLCALFATSFASHTSPQGSLGSFIKLADKIAATSVSEAEARDSLQQWDAENYAEEAINFVAIEDHVDSPDCKLSVIEQGAFRRLVKKVRSGHELSELEWGVFGRLAKKAWHGTKKLAKKVVKKTKKVVHRTKKVVKKTAKKTKKFLRRAVKKTKKAAKRAAGAIQRATENTRKNLKEFAKKVAKKGKSLLPKIPRSLRAVKCIKPCWKKLSGLPCLQCLDRHLKVAQLPVSYLSDMLKFPIKKRGYTEGWCGKKSHHKSEGVDIKKYPSGWMPNPKYVPPKKKPAKKAAPKHHSEEKHSESEEHDDHSDEHDHSDDEDDHHVDDLFQELQSKVRSGEIPYDIAVDAGAEVEESAEKVQAKYIGCEKSTDFPGRGSVSYNSHAAVKEMLKAVPREQYKGKFWRGNELGFIVSSPMFWSKSLKPQSSFLGSTVKQHIAIRPILDRLWKKCDSKCEKYIEAAAQQFMNRDRVRVQTDLKIFVHDIIFDMTFKKSANPFNKEDFIKTQSSFTKLSTIVQMLPKWAGTRLGKSTIKKLKKYFSQLLPLVKKEFGGELAALDCRPSKDCAHQLTGAIMDALLAAGGLAVPGALSTGLWVMYGDSQSVKIGGKQMFPEKLRIEDHDPLAFYYESLRFFAPVVGFPYWTKKPKVANNPEGSQWENGKRTVLNLAMAQKDPNAWGADAHIFKVRTLKEYHKNFVGFADTAEDPRVAGGAMDRVCPAKDLALKIGKQFFKYWDQDEWIATTDSKYKEQTPFVDEFLLIKPKARKFWKIFWQDVLKKDKLKLALPLDHRFDHFSRGVSAVTSADYAKWKYPTAKNVNPPVPHKISKKMQVGLAFEVTVPKEDESWTDGDDLTVYLMSTYAKIRPFPERADQCGRFRSGEHPESLIQKKLFGRLNPKRILVPWRSHHKYTDAGFEDVFFRGVGQHRLQKVRPNDPHKGKAKYAVYLDFAEGLEVKPGFAKQGGIAYFNADTKVSHIRRLGKTYTPEFQGTAPKVHKNMSQKKCEQIKGDCYRSKKTKLKFWQKKCDECTTKGVSGWKHVKMAFLGTFSAVMTAIDHLYSLHLVASNAIITANAEALHHTHPIRALLTPHGFRTAAINWQAATGLVNEFGLVHRAMPFTTKGLRQVYTFARTTSAGIMFAPMPARHAAQGVPELKLPLHEDGKDFYNTIHKYIKEYIRHFYPKNNCEDDKQLQQWHKVANKIMPNHDLPKPTCKNLEQVISTFIYLVTAGHTHVGAITAEVEDPCHMPWGFRDGDLCGTPRTTYTTLVTMAATSMEQPKLYDDYSHVFMDPAAKKIYRRFYKSLGAFGKRVDERNSKRKRKFKSFDLRYVEVSIGI